MRLTGLLVFCGSFSVACGDGAGEIGGNVTVVASKVSSDYVRTKLPDGSYQAETYAFGNGGRWSGTVVDGTIDKVVFMDVALAIAGPLAKQGYATATNPKTTRQLLMVYWGRTLTPERFESTVGSSLLQRATAAAVAVHGANSQFQTFPGKRWFRPRWRCRAASSTPRPRRTRSPARSTRTTPCRARFRSWRRRTAAGT